MLVHAFDVEWRVSERAGKARSLERLLYKDALNHLEWVGQTRWDAHAAYLKSKVRSKVEHNFYIVKRVFGYCKVRYRGLGKNGGRLRMLFGLANILRWSWRQDSLGALVTAA